MVRHLLSVIPTMRTERLRKQNITKSVGKDLNKN